MTATNYSAAAAYYERLGWSPGTFGATVWVVASRPVEAIDTPEDLGRRAMKLLQANHIHVPTFQAPDQTGTRWVFLTGHRDTDWYDFASRFTEFDIEHFWACATLDLPPSRVDNDQLTWLIPPVYADLPPFSTVARAVLQAANSQLCRPREMP